MSEGLRIGVFGGTFDPIHTTHLRIAETALGSAKLDQILFVVAARPPHKRGGTVATPEDRYEMVRAALADQPDMAADDLELRREGPSYMVDTLRTLHERQPDAQFFLIIGMDSLVDLPGWRETEAILELAKVLAIPRPGESYDVPSSLEGKYELLPFDEVDVSSTSIRESIARRADVTKLVPSGALRYINQKGVYHAEYGAGA